MRGDIGLIIILVIILWPSLRIWPFGGDDDQTGDCY